MSKHLENELGLCREKCANFVEPLGAVIAVAKGGTLYLPHDNILSEMMIGELLCMQIARISFYFCNDEFLEFLKEIKGLIGNLYIKKADIYSLYKISSFLKVNDSKSFCLMAEYFDTKIELLIDIQKIKNDLLHITFCSDDELMERVDEIYNLNNSQ